MTKMSMWAGRIIGTLAVLFLLFDSVIHIMKLDLVVDAFQQLGYSADLAVPIGIIEIVCLALYVIPRTSILGAILLTGYLGGAVATNVRVGAPLFSNELFPVYVGIFLWGALYLLDSRVRDLVPIRKVNPL